MNAIDLSYLEMCNGCFEIEQIMDPTQRVTCMKCGFLHVGEEWTPTVCQLFQESSYEEHA
jgi:hypothetical protein